MLVRDIRCAIPNAAEKRGGDERSLAVLALQPSFVVAAMAAGLGYGGMNLWMNATPLAKEMCGLEFNRHSSTVLATLALRPCGLG